MVALVTVVTMRVYTALPSRLGVEQAIALLAVAAGVLVGGLCGLVNGLLVTRLKLPPFVATLGMFGIARGLAVWLAERRRWRSPSAAGPSGSMTLAPGAPAVQPRLL